MNGAKGSLRKRITLIVVLGIAIILSGLGIASNSIIQKNIDDSLNRRQALARLVRNNIDAVLQDTINRLYDISLSGAVDLRDHDFRPEQEALKTAYRYSLFTDGVFLLDRSGKTILDYPGRIGEAPPTVTNGAAMSRMLFRNRPVISNVLILGPSRRKVVTVLVPLQDRNGFLVGAAGGVIDTTNPLLLRKLGLIDMGENETIDVVDANGVILASSTPSRMFTQYNRDDFFTSLIDKHQEQVTTCYSCHAAGNTRNRRATILAFSPLTTAPWGVAIQEPRADLFAPVARLKRTFVALGLFFMGIALLLTIGINRSIVDPLKALIRSADRIARGRLTEPIPPAGSDEIGVLSRTFETMRRKLVESLDRIVQQNLDLERRVEERTHQIAVSRQKTEVLLKKVITSQEDERKRIARELHDATLQDLSAALMRIDLCKLRPDAVAAEDVNRIRNIVLGAWDGVINIIRDLRPTLLDDLGLTEAIRSLLETHLGKAGVAYSLDTEGVKDMRFRPVVEITLFRIVQEAVQNIARHAKAANVTVRLRKSDDTVQVAIEDDGEGFDPDALSRADAREAQERRGLGLMGMQERAGLLKGDLEITSRPGKGTKIRVWIPLASAVAAHA